MNAKGVASLTDMVASPPRLNIYSDNQRPPHHDDRQGEVTVHYHHKILNLVGKATMSVKEATLFAFTVLKVCRC